MARSPTGERGQDMARSANRTAPTATLPAMSSFPPLVSISFIFYLSLPILRQIAPLSHMMTKDPSRRDIAEGCKASPLFFKATRGT
jgi:hypothetical protein